MTKRFDFLNHTVRILFVDDDEEDYMLVQDLLSSINDLTIEIDWESDFGRALEKLLGDEYDLCLLDYYLGEHNGLDLLKTAIAGGAHPSFVMLTGRGNRRVDLEAMNVGADFYVDKNQLDAFDLERAIRYSLEHNYILRTVQELNEQLEARIAERTQMLVEAKEQLENEIAERERIEAQLRDVRYERQEETLNQIARPPQTRVTAQLLGIRTLRETDRGIYDQLVKNYSTLIDQTIEQRLYRVDHDVSDQLRTLADYIGSLRLSPRDVVEIHNGALKSRNDIFAPGKAEIYVEEGRLLILELMGYLTAYYRNFATSSSDN